MKQVKTDLNKALNALKHIRRELNIAVDKETALENEHEDDRETREWLRLRIGFLVSAGYELDTSCEILKTEIGYSDWVPIEHNLFKLKDEWPDKINKRLDIINAAEILKEYLDEVKLNNIKSVGQSIKRVTAHLTIFLDILAKAYDGNLIGQVPAWVPEDAPDDEIKTEQKTSWSDLYRPYSDKPTDLDDVVYALEQIRDTNKNIAACLFVILICVGVFMIMSLL